MKERKGWRGYEDAENNKKEAVMDREVEEG
jgi:hypothetical protein